MKIIRAEIEGFRKLENIEFQLKDLTLFSGEMGTGKTSKLLAILYNLTGSAPTGINLDEMINVNSDYMWIKIEIELNGKKHVIERSKRRGHQSILKTDLEDLPKMNENIFIEGREIARLFLGAPTEKTFRIDTLLGLSKYNQITTEISTNYIDRRIDDLAKIQNEAKKVLSVKEDLIKAKEMLRQKSEEKEEVTRELRKYTEDYAWAEIIQRKSDEYTNKNNEIRSKKNLIEEYKVQIESLPKSSPKIEETAAELQARYDASLKRVAFLEAVMQILDLEGKRLDEIPTCPICGALISKDALTKFKHYDKEYRRIIGEITQLEVKIGSNQKMLDEAMRNRENKKVLQNQIRKLSEEVSGISLETVLEEDIKKTFDLLNKRDHLRNKEQELNIRIESLDEQVNSYQNLFSRLDEITGEEVDRKITKLRDLKERLQRIKKTMISTLSETRGTQISSLRTSFVEIFQRIYPYDRLKDVDFETKMIREREIIQVKGKVNDQWIYPNQMSTGENVAISFALLFAANKLETAPLLLLDEPEEGLDENGIQGLAEILKNIKKTTQLIIATRSPILSQLFKNSEASS